MKESALQALIVKYLTLNGWLVIHIPNQLSRGKITHAGILPGAPDLIALKNGQCVFIEVKAAGGRLSEKQAYIHELIKKQGFEVIVARSLDDVKSLL